MLFPHLFFSAVLTVLCCRVFGDKSAPDTVTSSEPHRVWIRFFEAHARHSRQSSTEELALIATAVSTALIDCDALSTAPESFGARVRLLHLGLTLLHTAHATTVTTPATLAQFVRAVSTDTTDPLHGRVAVSQCFVDARVCTTDGSPVSTDSWLFNGSRKSNAFSGGLGGLACFPPSLLQPLRSDSLDAADNYWNQPRFAPSPSPYDHTIAAGGLPGVPLDTSESAAPPKARKAFESSPPPVMGGDAWLVVAVGSLALFRQRILKAGLLWFALPQSCYEAVTSPERVREDFDYITGAFWGCYRLAVSILCEPLCFCLCRLVPSSPSRRALSPHIRN